MRRVSFSAVTMLVGRHEGQLACESLLQDYLKLKGSLFGT